jgi:hypothetical protein
MSDFWTAKPMICGIIYIITTDNEENVNSKNTKCVKNSAEYLFIQLKTCEHQNPDHLTNKTMSNSLLCNYLYMIKTLKEIKHKHKQQKISCI